MVDVNKIQYYLNSPLMKRIVELKERDYTEKDQFDDAPVNYEDAIENYKRILEITDEVSRNIIEPNSSTKKVHISLTDVWFMQAKLSKTSMLHVRLAFGVLACRVALVD